MIDVYAATGTFSDTHKLAQDLAAAVMRWEQVPDLALFRNNTAAFVHEMPAEAIDRDTAGDLGSAPVQSLSAFKRSDARPYPRLDQPNIGLETHSCCE